MTIIYLSLKELQKRSVKEREREWGAEDLWNEACRQTFVRRVSSLSKPKTEAF